MSFSPVPSYIFGTMFTGLGIVSLAAPKLDYELFGLPLEPVPASGASSGDQDGAVSPVMYAKGIRDLAFGLAYITFEIHGLSQAVTMFSAVLCFVAFGDGLVVWKNGGARYKKKALVHWGGLVPFTAWVYWRAQNW